MVEVMITSEGKQVKEEAELVVAVTLTRDADALLVRNICKGDFHLGSMAYGLGRAVDHILEDAFWKMHPEMKKRNVLRCMNSSEDTLGKAMKTRRQ